MEPEEYRKMAAVEDGMWFYRALHGHLERELTGRLGDRTATLLDVGCGTGGLIRRLAPRHPLWQWTGVDVSPLAVELARSRTATTIFEGSVAALPFADADFDAVVASDVLYHLDDDVAALREIARVMRRGGTLVVNVPAHRWLWSYHDLATSGKRRYNRPELAEKLAAAGFAGVSLTHWNMLVLPLVFARRRLLPSSRRGSDVHLYPAPIEAGFRVATRLESAWLRRGNSFDWGSSILATATKL